MKKTGSLFLIVLIVAVTFAFKRFDVTGKQFPDITGETLDKKQVTLPANCKGKPTFIGMAYSKKAEDDLRTWINPMYNKFIAKTTMIDQMIDANLFFIPMFTGATNITANIAINQLSDGTNRKYYPYIVCYRGKLEEYKDVLEMADKTKPYFFVLNKDGKIVYQTSGSFDQKKLEAIEDKLTD